MRSAAWSDGLEFRVGGGSGQEPGINASVDANRGGTGIVLIFVDWVPAVQWCVMPALSRQRTWARRELRLR
jgi:hypothetical protein